MMDFVNDPEKKHQCMEVLKLLKPVCEGLKYVDTRMYTAGDVYNDMHDPKSVLERVRA